MDTAQTTGLTCPKCSGFIPLSLGQLLKSREFLCPHCGLRLTIARKPSKQAVGENKSAEREKMKTDASAGCYGTTLTEFAKELER